MKEVDLFEYKVALGAFKKEGACETEGQSVVMRSHPSLSQTQGEKYNNIVVSNLCYWATHFRSCLYARSFEQAWMLNKVKEQLKACQSRSHILVYIRDCAL